MAPTNLEPISVDLTKITPAKTLSGLEDYQEAEVAMKTNLTRYMLEHMVSDDFTLEPTDDVIQAQIRRIRNSGANARILDEDIQQYRRVLKQHNLQATALILLHLTPVLKAAMETFTTAKSIWQFLSETYGAAALTHPTKVREEFDLATQFKLDDQNRAKVTYTDWVLNLVKARGACIRARQEVHVSPDIVVGKIINALQHFLGDVARELARDYISAGRVLTEADLQTIYSRVNNADGFSYSYRAHLTKKPTINTMNLGAQQTPQNPSRAKPKRDKKRKTNPSNTSTKTPDKKKPNSTTSTPTVCEICKRMGRTQTCFTCSNCKGHGHGRKDCATPVRTTPPQVNFMGIPETSGES